MSNDQNRTNASVTEINGGLKITDQMCALMNRVRDRQGEIHAWLKTHEQANLLPLYSSVDIRDSGFKAVVVDTNLFPGGFNNICEHGLADSVTFIRQAIERRVPGSKDIMIIAEEHTRNTWYLENLRILQEIITKAGYRVRIATFLEIQPAFCQSARYVDLETATQQTVRIFCFRRILDDFKAGREHFDLIILNNDLTTGIPDILKETNVPIYPSSHAGWHSRLKSHHFEYTNKLIGEFCQILEMDPWFFSCLFDVADNIDVNVDAHRIILMEKAKALIKRIEEKYKEHGITEKPYVVLKSDSGTYGRGVLAIENPEEILTLNRRDRNDLNKGKSSQVIHRFMIQEGVPTIYNIDDKVSEVCIYQMENNLVGGFYRLNSQKTNRENLNSQGMDFKKMCPHLKKYGDCGIHHDFTIFDVYRLLARIAGIAASQEIVRLEAEQK
jgi:glutamate--cysteine ligase